LNWFQGDYSELLAWLQVDQEPEIPLTLEHRIDRLEKAVFG
jgi:hypothetical protein